MNVIGMKIANMPIPSDTIFTCKTNWKRLAVHAWKSGSVRSMGELRWQPAGTACVSLFKDIHGNSTCAADWRLVTWCFPKRLAVYRSKSKPKISPDLRGVLLCWSLATDLSHIQSTHVTSMLEHASSILPLNPGISWLSLKASGVDILRALWNSR